MDILDAQVHIGPGRIDEMIAAMDALGIAAVLVDEYWFGHRPGDPAYATASGASRPFQPTAELAATLHPTRFSYLVRLDRNDAELPAIVRMARDAPSARALRVTPAIAAREVQAFVAGEYDPVFAAASDSGLPLFLFAAGLMGAIAPYARRFPDVSIVIDHCGMISNPMLRVFGGGAAPRSREEHLAAFDDVLALADLPNVALKWAHAPGMFELPGYPGEALRLILRSAIDRFGADRIMWASDASANQTGESWAELLFAIRSDPELSEAERTAILGGTARKWLGWPVSAGDERRPQD